MGNTACQQDCIYFTQKRNGGSSNAFGNLIDHGIQHQFGFFISVFNRLYDGRYIRSAKVRCQTGMAGNAFLQFILSETMGITKINQLPGRQCSRTFGRERTFTVKRIIHINSTPVMVSPNRNATTQMTDNQIQVFIAHRMIGRSGC